MPQELLYQERSIAEIGRINPDLWDFGRLPSPLLYRMRFRGFPPCPLLFPLPLSSDSANQRRSAKLRCDLLRVGWTPLCSARSDRPIVIARFRGSALGTIIPFPSSEDCDLRNASPQRSRPSLSIWSLLRVPSLPSNAFGHLRKGVSDLPSGFGARGSRCATHVDSVLSNISDVSYPLATFMYRNPLLSYFESKFSSPPIS